MSDQNTHTYKILTIGETGVGKTCILPLMNKEIPIVADEYVELDFGTGCVKMTPAHHSADFAELVCSNSLRSDELTNAVGLLKEELRRLDSLIMQCADATRVAAAGALAVDREGFARMVTEKLRACENVEIVHEEVTEIPEGEVIIATGGFAKWVLKDLDLPFVVDPTLTLYGAGLLCSKAL